MINLVLRFKRSLPARLLLVFILTSVCMFVLVMATLLLGFSSHWQVNVRPHLVQYLDYVNSDIGNPPSVEKAEELAQRLPINIYISGHGIDYSSTGTPLDLEDIEFHIHSRRWHGRQSRFRPSMDMKGQNLTFGEHHDRSVLRNQIGEYQVYYELPHRKKSFHRDGIIGKAMLGLFGILALSYLVLRRMLRPVQDIKAGVRRMGLGELDYRVPVRADNDLGEVSGSINKMAVDIKEMLNAKRQLLLAVSHELRSPLTRATIATQLLDESTNRNRIQDDLLEMENLITEILETERMNSTHATLNLSQVNIAALVRSVLEELPEKKVTVQTTSELPDMALDETRIRLLVRNLVANAISHGGDLTPPPSVLLSHADDKVTVSVRDGGAGMAAEHLSRVTEPFYRADPSRARATGGFGIGLYLCKLITEAHGGSMSIKSAPGKGTIVEIELPVSNTYDQGSHQ